MSWGKKTTKITLFVHEGKKFGNSFIRINQNIPIPKEPNFYNLQSSLSDWLLQKCRKKKIWVSSFSPNVILFFLLNIPDNIRLPNPNLSLSSCPGLRILNAHLTSCIAPQSIRIYFGCSWKFLLMKKHCIDSLFHGFSFS